jgi:preprotein translocase subunit SecE
MAKSRAQRKAEQRKKREQELQERARRKQAEAQHDTQVPESGTVAEVEAEMQLHAAEAEALAPSRADVGQPESAEIAEDGAETQLSRRERRRAEKERERRARESAERRAPKEVKPEKQRGRVMSFFGSVINELRKVQWPDRDTLIQASTVTLIFVAVAALYLGALDAVFSRLVELFVTGALPSAGT